jgi:hypothetical protein
MKSKRIELYHWQTNNGTDMIDVDWPKVQKAIGIEQVTWLLKQPHEQCHLVVDKVNDDFKLMAEFYDERTLLSYHLMWAK